MKILGILGITFVVLLLSFMLLSIVFLLVPILIEEIKKVLLKRKTSFDAIDTKLIELSYKIDGTESCLIKHMKSEYYRLPYKCDYCGEEDTITL